MQTSISRVSLLALCVLIAMGSVKAWSWSAPCLSLRSRPTRAAARVCRGFPLPVSPHRNDSITASSCIESLQFLSPPEHSCAPAGAMHSVGNSHFPVTCRNGVCSHHKCSHHECSPATAVLIPTHSLVSVSLRTTAGSGADGEHEEGSEEGGFKAGKSR